MLWKRLILLGGVGLAACSFGGTQSSHETKIVVTLNEASCEILGNVIAVVSIDGSVVGTVRLGQSVEKAVSAGTHSYRATGNLLGLHWEGQIQVESGQTFTQVLSCLDQ